MPRGRRSKGPRLAWRKARPEKHQGAGWVIRDCRHEVSTGCGLEDAGEAGRALQDYLAAKHVDAAKVGSRHPSEIPVADVLVLYARTRAELQARPNELLARIEHLLIFWG